MPSLRKGQVLVSFQVRFVRAQVLVQLSAPSAETALT